MLLIYIYILIILGPHKASSNCWGGKESNQRGHVEETRTGTSSKIHRFYSYFNYFTHSFFLHGQFGPECPCSISLRQQRQGILSSKTSLYSTNRLTSSLNYIFSVLNFSFLSAVMCFKMVPGVTRWWGSPTIREKIQTLVCKLCYDDDDCMLENLIIIFIPAQVSAPLLSQCQSSNR